MPITVAVPPRRIMPNACWAVTSQADGLEGVVHAAAGQLQNLLHWVAVGGIDRVGGTQAQSGVQLPGLEVNGNDRGGAGYAGGLERRHAHAAAADDRDGGAQAPHRLCGTPRRCRW